MHLVVRLVIPKTLVHLTWKRKGLLPVQRTDQKIVEVVHGQLCQNFGAMDGGKAVLAHSGLDEQACVLGNKQPRNASEIPLSVGSNPVTWSKLRNPPLVVQ